MKRLLAAAALILALTLNFAAKAEDYKPDDSVVFNLSAESWVTTKTARVTLSVEAAVSSNTAGTMRADMTKAVNDMVKADWRVTSFNRSQDSTGLERWSAQYEARVPENELNGLNDKAKKSSKAGMQITVADVNFTPTLEENQAAENALRTQIYKLANEQLATLNATIAGRNYRIASVDFLGMPMPTPIGHGGRYDPMLRTMAKQVSQSNAEGFSEDSSMASMERSEKLVLTARVVLAAPSPVAATTK
ncbi:MAG TPA: hypothetical protein DCY07_06535 [Rhodospirillaceae bacterium]|nr:hypothetical protein [Rhodospirillaceae bacterium]